jgi:hypothetical protein
VTIGDSSQATNLAEHHGDHPRELPAGDAAGRDHRLSLAMAGTVVEASSGFGNIRKLAFACVADASDGSFPRTAIVSQVFWPAAEARHESWRHELAVAVGLEPSVSASASRSPSVSRLGVGVSPSISPSASRSPSASVLAV